MNTKRINIVCFVFVLCSSFSNTFSQESKFSSGFFAGENCMLTDTSSLWAMQTNPALLPFGKGTECGVAYSTNYMATDMVCTRINACARMKQLTTATSVVVYGNAYFRESYFDVYFARKLNGHNALGITCGILRQYQEEYNSKTIVFPELAYYGEQGKLSYGIHLINPIRLFKSTSQVESITKLQTCYRINRYVSCCASIEKATDKNPSFSVGCAYSVKQFLHVSLAYSTHETPLTLLLQFPLWRVRCYYETAYNYYLGMNHSVGFSVKI